MASGKRLTTKKPVKKAVKKAVSAKKAPTTKPTTKTRPKSGRGAMNGLEHNKKPFSSEYQPSKEARSAGQKKRYTGQELARHMLGLTYMPLENDEDVRKKVSQFMGIPLKDVTLENVMIFRQMEKAIMKNDTQAFIAVTDRAHGKPVVYTEVKADIDLTEHPIVFE